MTPKASRVASRWLEARGSDHSMSHHYKVTDDETDHESEFFKVTDPEHDHEHEPGHT